MPELLTPQEQQDIKIIPSFIYPELGRMVADELGVEICGTDQRRFPNGELYARSCDNLRRKDVYIVASHVPYEGFNVNDAFVHSLLLADAAVHASAGEVSLISPMLGYQRQDRKALGRESVGARIVRQAVEATGVNRVMTIDGHSPAVQSGYDIIFDHLTAMPELEHSICQTLKREDRANMLVVAPDAGAMKASQYRAKSLGVECIEMSKGRNRTTGEVTRSHKARRKEVGGKVCLIFDDMIDTGGTVVSGAKALKDSGASKVVVAATHGIFSGPALERFQSDAVDLIVVSDTFPMDAARNALGEKLSVVSVAPLLAKTITALHRGDSVSDIFDQQNYR
jgi:ribose-phosphate pyrophosphokinase